MSEFTFSQVPVADIPRSVFNRSHGHKTTLDAGYLIPFYVDEALPGDTFSVRASLFARLATPIVPIMDNLHMDVFFFAVPNRILWSNFKRMMGERPNPADSIDFLVPIVTPPAGGYAIGTIFDYFGVPTAVPNIQVSALFPRAYNRIWNDWFRDENLQDRAQENTGDGPDLDTHYGKRRRGKRHDYFTSCLPWPQKSLTPVSLPLGTSAPVVSAGTGIPTFEWDGLPGGQFQFQALNNEALIRMAGLNSSGVTKAVAWDNPQLQADLSTATSATINALREAFQIQRLLERDARGGTRYIEIVRSHFGVVSPDARVQRAEYLGGGSVPVIINPVTQTSAAAAQPTPQGNMAGYGVAAGTGLGFTKSFTEHCVVMGLVQVRADLTYQQGLNKMFSRRTRYDFYWPAFAHLGEQAVKNKEIYAQGNATDEEVFGYQERWAEYRYFPSKITGKFRSSDAGTLDVWHLSQNFTALPVLNDSFIQDNPPVARCIAVTTEPHFLFDSHIAIKAARPMPTYSVPGLIDHF